ncbi:MAG TPA: hypothetical protein VJ695_10060, partial [Nitrososphaera sp.]|nr:hypothetical protein [Nitrososphaera sp.]
MSSTLTSTAAERIADEILSRYDGKILAISIIDEKTGGGNILATKTTESFEKTFGELQEGPKFGGTSAIAALSLANQERGIAGDTIAITTTYKKCKMMLIPIPSHEILVGFVLKRRVVLDEDRIANYIESLVADNAHTTTTANPP